MFSGLLSLLPGVLLAWCFLWFRPSPAVRVLAPLYSLAASTLLYVLAGGPGLLAVAGRMLALAALSFMLAEAMKAALRVVMGHTRAPIRQQMLVWACLAFAAATLAGELVGGKGLEAGLPSALNPRGLLTLVSIVLYWALPGSDALATFGGTKTLGRFVSFVALAMFVLDVMTAAGIVAGNIGKVGLGLGGVGLGGLSTNETAVLGLGLLLWVLWFRRTALGWERAVNTAALLACLGVVLMARSRVGLLAAGAVMMAYALTYGVQEVRRNIVPLLAVVFFVAVAVLVIRQRSGSEAAQFYRRGLRGADVPGGERVLVWASYGTSFMGAAQERPVRWLVGVGPRGLAALYDRSPLPELNISTRSEHFYPVHGDVLQVFLTSGALGLASVLLAGVLLFVCATHAAEKFYAFAALGSFAFVISADMLQYLPFGSSLLLSLFAVSTVRQTAPTFEAGSIRGTG